MTILLDEGDVPSRLNKAVEPRLEALQVASEHWSELVQRYRKTGSRRHFYALTQAFAVRLTRNVPEELSMIVDSLRSAVRQTETPTGPASQAEISLLLEFVLEISMAMNYSSREKRAAGAWLEFSKSESFKKTIGLLVSRTWTNTELTAELNVSKSRVSQILSTMRMANLIRFTQQGQSKHFELTELGQACAAQLNPEPVGVSPEPIHPESADSDPEPTELNSECANREQMSADAIDEAIGVWQGSDVPGFMKHVLIARGSDFSGDLASANQAASPTQFRLRIGRCPDDFISQSLTLEQLNQFVKQMVSDSFSNPSGVGFVHGAYAVDSDDELGANGSDNEAESMFSYELLQVGA